MRAFRARLLVLALGLALVAAPAAAGAAGGFEGPLFGLTKAKGGGLLLADASVGIHLITPSHVRTVVELPGATDASPIAKRSMWVTTTGLDPEADSGQALWRVVRDDVQYVANLFAFEEEKNPDRVDPADSNPFDVESLNWNWALVADAGGNDLLKVHKRGKVKLLAVFPDELVSTANIKALAGCPDPSIPELADFCFLPDMIPAQSVPTSVAVGPDGYYYVGELKGFPGPTGESSIWRVSPDARRAHCPSEDCVKVFDGGFTSIIDLAFSPNGKLYVAEMDEASWAAVEIFGTGEGGTINKCNIHTLKCKEIATGIPMLTAIAVGKHHAVWATQYSLIPGEAEVIKVR